MRALTLLVRMQAAHLRGRLQFRASFLSEIAIAFAGNFTSFLAIWVLVERFGTIGAFTTLDMALLYGLAVSSFGTAQLVFGGFEEVDRLVRSGGFDRVLTRPLSPFVQIAGSTLRTQRLGRMSEGLVLLVAALAWNPAVRLDLPAIAIVIAALAGGVLLYGAVLVTTAALALVGSGFDPSATSVASYGAAFIGRYPTSLFDRPLRVVLTFVIPVALVHYVPALLVLGRSTASLGPLAWLWPFAGPGAFGLALGCWRLGISRYQSAGG